MRALAVLTAALLLGGSAFAQADPEAAYRSFHQAILGAFDPPRWISHLTAAKRQKFDQDTQASLRWVNAVQFMKDDMPRSYQVTGKAPGPGARMRLTATGQGRDRYGKPETQTGTIDLVQEGGAWKIDDVAWGRRKLP